LRKVYVIGAGSTKYGKLPFTARDLALLAAREAIEKIELDPKQIQGAFVSNAFSLSERQGHLGPLIMSGLGISDAPATTIETACSSGASAFREAYINIAAGVYDLMLVVGTERVSHLDTITATTYFSYGSDYAFEGGNGASFPGLYAAMARAYMNRYNATEEDLALVAVKNHENGLLNEKAHLQKKITVEDVLRSVVIAHPLKLYDSCPFSDGAAAVILAGEELAKKYYSAAIQIAGSGRAGGTGALHQREDMTSLRSAVLASREALRQAGITADDIDFAEVHDCFTIAELIALEDIGLFERGRAAKATRDGLTKLNGRIPINPSGGLKSKGHPVGATGVGQVVEVFEQLNCRAGKRQVKDAKIGLTHSVGATGGSCAVHIFSRE
jgi:acetyl-CoA C-acetyltransferase